MRAIQLSGKPFNIMEEKVIKFNAKNVEAFNAQLELAKARLLVLCVRHLEDGPNSDVSVVRYNMAREVLKREFSVEVIGMLDASGFINDILCKAERKWLRERKVRTLNPTQLQKYLAWETMKGGNS